MFVKSAIVGLDVATWTDTEADAPALGLDNKNFPFDGLAIKCKRYSVTYLEHFPTLLQAF